jgi:hypothetical protein
LSSLGATACALRAKVLLNWKTRAVRGSVLGGLESLWLTTRRPVVEDERLRNRAIRQNSPVVSKVEGGACAVQEMTDVLLEIDRRPATLAAGSSHGRWARLRIDVINVKAIQVRRGHWLAGSILVLLLAFRQRRVRQFRAAAGRQSGKFCLTLGWRPANGRD